MIKKVLIPSDPKLFKEKLLITKQAGRSLIYKDGSKRVDVWDASGFTSDSDLMHNISSQLWRRKDKAEIVEAIYEIAEDGENPNRRNNVEENRPIDVLIHYEKGWSSFRPVGEHITGYTIENNIVTIYRNNGFAPGKTETKTISDKDMRVLLAILDEAVNIGAFEESDTVIGTAHGAVCTYEYDYRTQSGRNCGSLFKNDVLNKRYRDFVNKIIC